MPDIFPQHPLLHGLTEMEPLPIPMDTVIDTEAGGMPKGGRMGPLPPSRANGMDTTVGQVTSPKGCGILIGWLNALGKRASTIGVYMEESMVTLARSGNGLVGRNRRGKGKIFWQDHSPLLGSCRVKAFFSYIPVFNVCLSEDCNREMKISSN